MLEAIYAQVQRGAWGLSDRELRALVALPEAVGGLQGALEAEVTARKAAQEAESLACESVAAKADKNSKILLGNGEPERGLVVRFDRQERAMKTLTAFIYALSVGTTMALIAAFLEHLPF